MIYTYYILERNENAYVPSLYDPEQRHLADVLGDTVGVINTTFYTAGPGHVRSYVRILIKSAGRVQISDIFCFVQFSLILLEKASIYFHPVMG